MLACCHMVALWRLTGAGEEVPAAQLVAAGCSQEKLGAAQPAEAEIPDGGRNVTHTSSAL